MMDEAEFDLEKVLPLELIRSHTKSDDDLRADDSLLRLYRKAAFEAAEKWTGQSFSGLKTVTEIIENNFSRRRHFGFTQKIRLKKQAADGIVTFYGGGLAGSQRVYTAKGGRTVSLPFMFFSDGIMCCAPCGHDAVAPMRAVYKTGFACGTELPAAIIMGCLKYIAWQIGNPGDELVTMQDSKSKFSAGIAGTNNAVIASGAAEEWRLWRL